MPRDNNLIIKSLSRRKKNLMLNRPFEIESLHHRHKHKLRQVMNIRRKETKNNKSECVTKNGIF